MVSEMTMRQRVAVIEAMGGQSSKVAFGWKADCRISGFEPSGFVQFFISPCLYQGLRQRDGANPSTDRRPR